jgi:thiol oxidase
MRALASFFPTKPQGTIFLEHLRDWVLSMEDVIKGDEFLKKVDSLEKSLDFVMEPKEWIGCKGSHHRYRGYTCGLWTMFHALTVNAASQNKKRPTPGSDNVLKSILQYVKYFFGCDGCSKHFQEMAVDKKLESVTGLSESVIWLWDAHNTVNKRIKGDITEDPEHPKLQYPGSNSCFNCKEIEGGWNQDNVINYLKERYSKKNICQQEKVGIALCKPFITKEVGDVTSGSSPTLSSLKNIVIVSGWDFNVADISLCVFLYACSAIILILVYIKFVVRRGYRKKYNLS